MKAVGVKSPGGVDQLHMENVPDPPLESQCVRIAVRAAGLNRADLLQRRGLYPPPAGESEIMGLECAGEIIEVAEDLTNKGGRGWVVGDRVMALLAGGGYAEQVVVPAAHTMPIADNLSFAQAAAIPEAFLTAQEALFSLGQLKAGQTVLIHAAAGGVGSAAVQMAYQKKASVIATASTDEKLALAHRLGAQRVVNYRNEDFAEACREATAGKGVSLIIDFVGATHAQRHQKALGFRGQWVVVGVLGGSRVELNFAQLLMQRWAIHGLVMRSRSGEEKAAFVQCFKTHWLSLFASGQLVPVVDREYSFDDVALAQQRMEDNANLGKVILTM